MQKKNAFFRYLKPIHHGGQQLYFIYIYKSFLLSENPYFNKLWFKLKIWDPPSAYVEIYIKIYRPLYSHCSSWTSEFQIQDINYTIVFSPDSHFWLKFHFMHTQDTRNKIWYLSSAEQALTVWVQSRGGYLSRLPGPGR